MAGKYGASDLGSDWITVPRKFRGRKPTSSDTELAYITGAEKGLLSRFANANQVGPENIPSYDDSGFQDPKYYTPTVGKKATQQPKFKYTPPTTRAMTISGNKTRLAAEQQIKEREMSQAPGSDAVKKAMEKGKSREVKPHERMSGPERDYGNRWKNVKEGKGDGGDTTTSTADPCQGRGRNPDGSCKSGDAGTEDPCKGKDLTCPSDRPNGTGVCTNGNVDFSGCKKGEKTCPHGTDAQGNCLPNQETEAGGPERPSLNTILQADQAPMLQELTNDMDLRNMLTNVLNKNNPLFKQARTRALQAMAGRGIVNSSMAEEAVMNAVMNVAMPIATRVIDDLQRVMAANVNASNAFKQALNQAYYEELLKRVDAANTWNLNKMTEAGANWRAILEAKTGAAGIKGGPQFERYMAMLSKMGTGPSP